MRFHNGRDSFMYGLKDMADIGAVLAENQFQTIEAFQKIRKIKNTAVFTDGIIQPEKQHFILGNPPVLFSVPPHFLRRKQQRYNSGNSNPDSGIPYRRISARKPLGRNNGRDH